MSLISLLLLGNAASSFVDRRVPVFGKGVIHRSTSDDVDRILSLRGGALGKKATKASKSGKSSLKESKQGPSSSQTKTAVIAASTVTASWFLYKYRSSWMGVFDKEKLLEATIQVLRDLNSLPKQYSYTAYALGMAIWEMIGLSTIPVETAAGMVFGWHGFLLSGIGKLLGAVAAFLVGRGFLANFIQEKLSGNSVIQLLDDVAEDSPLAVLMLLKASCFPENIKNFGSALLQPIKLWMFTLGTVIHGWLFSALWTYLGVDAALRLETPALPLDVRLQFFLSLALVNGFVISPLSMAYGVKALRSSASKKPANKRNKR